MNIVTPETNNLNTFHMRISGVTKEYIELMIGSAEKYFNDIIQYRGYLYMNFIYEYFSVQWSPNFVNTAFVRPIKISFEEENYFFDGYRYKLTIKEETNNK